MNQVEHFEKICDFAEEIFLSKNKQYGNTIVETGVLGASVELIGAVARLKQLVLRNPQHGADQILALQNVFMDIHNYSVIGMMMLEKANFIGKENKDE